MPGRTITAMFHDIAKKHAQRPALHFKKFGQWQTLTWKEYWDETSKIGRGLCAHGLNSSDRVVIFSQNNERWVLAHVASILCQAIPAGIYPTSSSEQIAYITQHSRAKIAFVENLELLKKVMEVRSQLHDLKFIVLMYGKSEDEGVLTWDKVISTCDDFSEAEFKERREHQSSQSLATLVYTSGTTSNPKAVMLSHHNLCWMAKQAIETGFRLTENDRMISYLPLSHIAEQLLTIYGPMQGGNSIYFAESLETLLQNLKEVKPTVFMGVPRVWEKMHSSILNASLQNQGIKQKLGKWAKKIGEAYYATSSPSLMQSLSFYLARALIFKKVRKALGLEKCRIQITGAAPVSKETLRFFTSLDIPLYEVYGMSECTGPTTISLPGSSKLGKAGKVLAGSEIRIASDGEILIRGEHVFMGYLDDQQSTEDAIDEKGWLHSGDLGSLDAEGFLDITGRKKNLIITAGGENIAPEMIEKKFKTIPEVEHAVVIGDKRNYLSLLITLDPVQAKNTSQRIGSHAQSLEELSHCHIFRDYLEKQVALVNKSVARVQTIKKFEIIPHSFSEDQGELTPTLKVKRAVICRRYSQEIEGMYR